MAQLPPKIPTNCPSLAAAAALPSHWSWDDDFFDFSASKLASHLTTIGHPVAVFEPLPAPNSPMPSVPSDHIRDANEDDNRPSSYDPSEEESSCNLPLSAATIDMASQLSILDPKRVKRILANRQSARRSRVRKLQYISELENIVNTLQTKISGLSSTVVLFDQQRSILNLANGLLKQRIAALAQDKIFKDAHQESLTKEIERLSLVYQQQNLEKMAAMTAAVDDGGDDAATIVNVQNDLLANP